VSPQRVGNRDAARNGKGEVVRGMDTAEDHSAMRIDDTGQPNSSCTRDERGKIVLLATLSRRLFNYVRGDVRYGKLNTADCYVLAYIATSNYFLC